MTASPLPASNDDDAPIAAAVARLMDALAGAPKTWPGVHVAGETDDRLHGDPVTLHVAMTMADPANAPVRHLMVFGAGSAAWELGLLATHARGATACTIVEHDPDTVREILQRQCLLEPALSSRWCSLTVAPLVLRRHEHWEGPVYRHAEIVLAREEPADVILVYGPPRELGGRRAMLLQALTFARRGTIILLPGLGRQEHRDISALLERRRDLAGRIDCSTSRNRRLAAVAFQPLAPADLTPTTSPASLV